MKKPQILFTFTFLIIVNFSFTQNQPNLFTSQLKEYFEIEGNNPYYSDTELHFSALQSKYLSTNGHGWRNEIKKMKKLRKSMYETTEMLSAKIQPFLSHGAKTIIMQYHDNMKSTLVKIIIADIRNTKLLNGIPSDGIFDVYAVIRTPSETEEVFPFITIKYGETFNQSVENKVGHLKIKINSKTITTKTIDCPDVNLKMGNYLQAQDPFTSKQETDQNNYENFYNGLNIVEDTVIFTDVNYSYD